MGRPYDLPRRLKLRRLSPVLRGRLFEFRDPRLDRRDLLLNRGTLRVSRLPRDADGRRLVLRRQRPCPSTSVRPALSWDVGGGGGRLAATVPDGAWEAVLEDATGSRLKGPVSVRVAGAAEVVPPW